MTFKNPNDHPVDVGGRMLAGGEVADLDAKADATKAAVEACDVVPVVTKSSKASEKNGDA